MLGEHPPGYPRPEVATAPDSTPPAARPQRLKQLALERPVATFWTTLEMLGVPWCTIKNPLVYPLVI